MTSRAAVSMAFSCPRAETRGCYLHPAGRKQNQEEAASPPQGSFIPPHLSVRARAVHGSAHIGTVSKLLPARGIDGALASSPDGERYKLPK